MSALDTIERTMRLHRALEASKSPLHPDRELSHVKNGSTHGLLAKVRDLNLPLLSVRRVEQDTLAKVCELRSPEPAVRLNPRKSEEE
jgi:hypothetical protein